MSSSSTNGQQFGQATQQERVTIRDLASVGTGLISQGTGRLQRRLAYSADRRRQASAALEVAGRQPIRQRIGQLVQPGAHGQPQYLGAAEWSQVRATTPWTLTLDQRPQWPFGKGGIAEIFGALQQIRSRTPGAAIALVRCLAERQPIADQDTERGREQIVEELSRLLMRFRPTQASLDRAATTMQEMLELSQRDPANHGITRGRLTAKYGFLEQVYILRTQGLDIGYSDERLAREFAELDEELVQSGSTGRLGFVRAVRADIFLQQGNVRKADEAMLTAFGLLQNAFPDSELDKFLASAADSQLARQVKDQVKVLVAASSGHQQQHQPQ